MISNGLNAIHCKAAGVFDAFNGVAVALEAENRNMEMRQNASRHSHVTKQDSHFETWFSKIL
jgi:hypothetical protein